MFTEEQLKRLTPDELLVLVMKASAEVTIAANDCLRFGWDLQFGTGTNMGILTKKKEDFDQVVTSFLLSTRHG